MIVGIVGTTGNFDRLVGALADYARANSDEQVWIQHGGSTLARGVDGADFVSRGELLDRIAQAEIVVCHAASGTLADVMSRGHVPVVVPRLRRFGEVVNDHQLDVLQALADVGRVLAVRDVAELPAAIARARGTRRDETAASGKLALVEALRAAIRDVADDPRRPRREWLLRALAKAERWIPTRAHRWP